MMNLFARVSAFVIALITLLPAVTLGQTTWTGNAGDGLWSTAGNWSAGLPNATTDAVIPAGAGTVTVSSSANVRNLTVGRPLAVGSCGTTITLSGNLTLNNANITLNSQSCAGMVFSGGTLPSPAVQSITGTGEIISANGSQIQVNAYTTLNIASTITCRADTGNLSFSLSTASVVNHAGTFRGSGTNRTMSISGQFNSATPANSSQFTNTGTIRAENNASLSITTLPWTNSGTFEIAAGGSMNLGGRYSALGTISRTGTTTLTLSGTYLASTFVTSNATGPLTCAFTATQSVAFSSLDGLGTTVGSANLTSPVFDGAVQIVGGLNASSPTFNAGATITGCGATLTVTAGNLILPNSSVLLLNTQGCSAMTFNEGTAATPVTQSIVGTGEIVSGTGASISVSQWTTLSIPAGFTLRADAASLGLSLSTGSVLNNAGTIRANGANRTLTINGPFNSSTPANSSQFINSGTVRAEGSAGVNITTLPWTNNGTFLAATGGTLNLGGRYSTLGTLSRTGTTTVTLSGTYLGSSLVTSDLTGNLICAFTATQSVAFSSLNGRVTTIGTATLTSPVFNGPTSFVGGATATNPVFNASATVDQCGAGLTVSDGNLTLNNSSTITFNSQGCSGLGFGGAGTRQVLGNGSLVAGSASTSFSISGGTTVSIGSDISVVAETAGISWSLSSASTLVNGGTFRVGGANRAISISGTLGATPSQFTNNGTVLAQNSGAFSITSAVWTNPGTLSLASGGTMNLGGRYSVLGTINRSGTNTLTLSGEFIGTNFVASAATGNLVLASTFNNTAFSTLNGATITFSGGTHNNCTYNSPVSFSGTVQVTSPVFNAPATFLNCSAALTVSSGNLTLNADLTVDSQGCNFLGFSQGTVAAPASQSILGTGTIRVTNSGGSVSVSAGTSLNVASSVTLRGDNANLSVSISTAGTLNNAGTIRINGSSRNLSLGASGSNGVNNTGTILVEDRATCSLSGTINNTGIISIASGGVVTAIGTINQPAPGRLRIISTAAAPSTGIGRLFVQSGATYNIGGSTLEILSVGPDPCRGEAVILSVASGVTPANLVGTFGTTLLPPGLSNAQAILAVNGTTYTYRQTNPSDIAGANQSVGSDGLLTADDIIVYLGWYFASTVGNPGSPAGLRADVAGANQSVVPDGLLTADDIIVFLGRYFAGCS